jgi:Sigma-70, region 4
MSRLDELPPDQRAALSLLLAQGKSYAELAKLLGIGEDAVRARAHTAITLISPALARELSAERRAEVSDYLLDQQPGVAERISTRSYLEATPQAREWAQALAAELAPLSPTPLPAIPASGPAPEPAPASTAQEQHATPAPARPASAPAPEPAAASPVPPARPSAGSERAPASSRVGGAVLLALIVAAIVVTVVLLNGGGSKAHRTATGAATPAATATGPTVGARLPLRAPGSNQVTGLVQILSEGSRRAFYAVVEKLHPTHGFFYALWLYNRPGSSEPLGKAPAVGSSGRLEGGGALPADAEQFKEILLTRETSTHAAHPGAVVLRGAFSLSG